MFCKGVFIPKGGWTVFLCENTGLISSFLRAPYCSIGSTSVFVLEIKQEFPVWEMSRSVKTAFFSGALKFSLDQDSQMQMQCKCVCSGIHLQDYCKAEAGMFLFEVQQSVTPCWYFFHNSPEGCGFDETNLLIPCVITRPFPRCAIPGTSLCWLRCFWVRQFGSRI